MRAGKMRHRVTINVDQSSDSAEVNDFQPVHTGVPCNIVDIAGAEKFRGEQLEATTTHIVEMRVLVDFELLPTMQLVDARGRVLEIINSLDKTGRERYLQIQCSQVTQ